MAVELEVQEEGGDPQPQGERQPSQTSYFYYLGLVVVVIGLASCVMQLQFRGENCSLKINDGAWIKGKWHSHHCLMQYFDTGKVYRCLTKRPHVVLIGGSSMQYYHQKLGELQAEVQQQSHVASKINVVIEMLGDPGLETASFYNKLAAGLDDGPSLLILHKLQHGSDDEGKCRSEAKQLVAAQEVLVVPGKEGTIKEPPLVVTILSDLSETCREIAKHLYANSSLPYISLPHSAGEDFPSHELNMVLNLFCNSPANATCCVPTLSDSLSSYVNLDASFLLLILALYLGIWLVFATGATFALSPYLESMSCNLERFFTILHCVGGTCTVLFYMLLADRLDYFTRVNNVSNPLLLILLLVTILIATGATLSKRKKREFLAHDQVSEWRGWMILVLIAVNYSNMEEVVWIHLVSRLLVGGVLFLGGYTHFMYFWQSGSVTLKRVLHVLLDLNFIPVCVCLTLGSSYGAYYLVPLLSVNFLFTAAFLALWPSMHTIKQNLLGPAQMVIVVKFAAAFILISYLLPLVKEPLASTPLRMFLQSFDDCPYAIYNWFYEQRHMTLMGMTVAMLVVQLRGEYSHFVSYYEQPLKKNALIISTLFAVGYVVFLVKCEDKDFCMKTQSHIAVLPLLAYVYLRNSVKRFQYYYSTFLSQAGSVSLWLFVSHFHILLAKDGKGLLVLIPRFFYLNILAVVTVYLFFFLVVHRSMTTLKAWFRSSKKTAKVTNSSLVI